MRKFKITFSYILLISVILSMFTPLSVFADEVDGSTGNAEQAAAGELAGVESTEAVEQNSEGGGLFGRLTGYVIDVFRFILVAIIEPLTGLQTMDKLVYGEDLYYLIFSESEWEGLVLTGMGLTLGLAYTALIVGVLYVGYMLNKTAINPQTRTSFMELVAALLFVAVLLNNIVMLYQIMMSMNQMFVNIFKANIEGNGNMDFGDLSGGLGALFLFLVYLGLSLWANIYYIMRKFTIIILMILGPIFISLFIFPHLRGLFGAWLRELFATIMVQSIHVCILWIFLMMDDGITESWVVKMVVLSTFIPISEGVKQLFSLQDSTSGRSATMAMLTGAAGVASMYSATQSAMGKNSLNDNLSRRYGGDTGRQTQGQRGNVSGTGSGNADAPLSTVPMSKKTARLQQVGRITGNLGKGVGTVMGSAVGMAFGPAGVFAGGMMGGKAGQVTGGFAGRAGTAITQAGGNMYGNIKESVGEESKNIGKYDEIEGRKYPYPGAKMQRIAHGAEATTKGVAKGIKKTFSRPDTSNMTPAEKKMHGVQRAGYVGHMIGGEGLGNAAGSFANRFNLQNKDIQAQGMEMTDLGNSGIQNMRVAVTREHSTVLGTTPDGAEKRLTQYKGGDMSLKDGEIIYKDYHVNQGRIQQGGMLNMRTVEDGGYYREDSRGGKQYVNKDYQMNPNEYFENRADGSEKYFKPNRFKQGIV